MNGTTVTMPYDSFALMKQEKEKATAELTELRKMIRLVYGDNYTEFLKKCDAVRDAELRKDCREILDRQTEVLILDLKR